jgi:SAM-dependent methyltransferase
MPTVLCAISIKGMLRLIVFSLSWASLFAFTKSSLCHYGRREHADDICVLLHANHFISEDEYNIHRRSLLASSTMLLFPAFAAADDEQVLLDGESQCKDGKIASESAVPGAYQQICMSMDQRSFTMKSSGDIITIVQGANSAGGSVAGRTGVAVWNSGILLTRLLDKINSIDSSIFKGKTVLELGCGAGLASIALAKFGAASVLATDANEEVLKLAQQNFQLNNVTNVAKTVALRWGMLDASEYDSVADIVVGSDLTYNSGSWLSLAETMATVLKADGIVLYLTLGHSGFNAQAELQGFLQVAENAGLQVIQEEQIFGQNLSDILGRITSSDEKQLINANGGAKAIVLQRKSNKKYR